MIILISYKLTAGKDYNSLYATLKAAPAATWWHYVDNLWLIKTTDTPSQLADKIRPHLNRGIDTLLITKVELEGYHGWLPKSAHEWIKENR